MKDYERIKQLIASGYIILGNVFPLTRFKTDKIENFAKVFAIRTDKQTLLDPSNQNKSLIIFRNLSTKDQVEIITLNEKAILLAQKQIKYQREPIGILIRSNCVALGGRSSYQRVFHLDRLIPSLDRLWGWKFILDKEVGRFIVEVRINSNNPSDAEKVMNKLQHLLDYISIHQEVGFHIQHTSISPIPRIEPTISSGQEERRLEPISFSENEIDRFLRSPSEILVSVRGLNQSYIENCMPSRLAILWSAFESVFDYKPTPLLFSKEIKELIKACENIPTLIENSERLHKLKWILSDPNRLPLKNRNERMSENVARIMKISPDEAYKKVQKASKIRGKHLHKLRGNWKEMEQSEKFLQEALKQYAQTSLRI